MSCGGNLFGPSSQFIKTNGGDLIATEGASTKEKMMLSDLRIPYKQISKGRITLKPGEVNYPLNHLGLGDNATFLSLKVIYNSKSKFEFDNYINWNFYDDFSKSYPISNLLVLTGNSKNRIKQIYLHNTNQNYPVTIEAMIAVIDDNISIFADRINQSGLSFKDVRFIDIKTWKPGETIVIYSNPTVNSSNNQNESPLIFIPIDELIESTIEKNGKIIKINNLSVGSIYLDFVDVYNALQGYSILEWVKTTTKPNASIQIDLGLPPYPGPYADMIDPIVYFTSNVDILGGSTYSSPYDTTMATTFSATMSLSATYSISSNISRDSILSNLIIRSTDNRDTTVSLGNSSILIYDDNNDDISENGITSIGTYSIHFNIMDYAGNSVDANKNIQLEIIN